MALSVNAVYFKTHLDELCEISLKTELKHHLINKTVFLKIHLFWNSAFMQEIKWISWKLSQASTSNHHAEFSPYLIKIAGQGTKHFSVLSSHAIILELLRSLNFTFIFCLICQFLGRRLCYFLTLLSSLPVNSNSLCSFRFNTMDF